jgi:hypothetical protein
LTKESVCDEEARIETRYSAHTTSTVWVLIVLEVALIVLAAYVLWERVSVPACFSRPGAPPL